MEDIIGCMNSYEKQDLANVLYDDGFVPKQVEHLITVDELHQHSEFDEQVLKLIGNSWRLSKEDEESILKITNKIIS
jgi:hypothetical protein